MIKYRTFKGVMKMNKNKKRQKNIGNKIYEIVRNHLLKKESLFSQNALYQNPSRINKSNIHKQESTIPKEDSIIQIDKTITSEEQETENNKMRKTEDNWRRLKKETNLEQLKRYQEFLIYLQKKKEMELNPTSFQTENLNQSSSSKQLKR